MSVVLKSSLKLDPLAIILVIVNHVLMIVVGGVEVVKHGQGLNLRPSSPGSNHFNIKATVTDPMLASTTAKRVSPIQGPG